MARTTSIGDPGPDFTLLDLRGKARQPSDFRGQITILNFWSAECPWSSRADQELLSERARWGEQVVLVTVACNANEPLELITKTAADRCLPVVLIDPQQAVTDLYGAVTNPHFFVLDARGILRYQGALDDVTFRKRQPSRRYLVEAVDALIHGEFPNPASSSPYGCTIVRYSLNFQ